MIPLPLSWFRYTYLVFCIALVVGLFFSPAAISISVIALSVLWIIEPGILERCKALIKNKVSLAILGFYLLHVIGILWSQDLDYALKDLRIKLPLLAMPFALGTGCKLRQIEVRIVWWFFLASAIIAAIVSVEYGISNELADKRDWSPFISHIRLSLLTILAFFVALIHAKYFRIYSVPWLVLITTALLLLGFLFVLNAFSGIIALVPAAIYWAFLQYKSKSSSLAMRVLSASVVCVLLGLITYASQIAKDFYSVKDLDWQLAEQYSEQGEQYHFEWGNPIKENGHFVKYYLTQDELASSWGKRSSSPLFNDNREALPILETVHRYMSSKGLRKDSVGVSKLTNGDIEAIENGVTNYLFLEKGPFFKRVYSTIQELDHYSMGHGAEGGSLTQRFVYWQTAWQIIKDVPFNGVGTGDVQLAFDEKYEILQNLPDQFRLRAHNQYLTVWVTFGIGGFFLFIYCLILPFYSHQKSRSAGYVLFWLIMVVSMLNEDTLETQVGVTIFAFFFFFLLHQGIGSDQERRES